MQSGSTFMMMHFQRMPLQKLRCKQQQGFTMVAVLVAMLLLALSTQGVLYHLAGQAQREREQRTVEILKLYETAILAYYQASPGTVKQYPKGWDDLLFDKRQLGTVRHLRRVYPNPYMPQVPAVDAWQFELDALGRVTGVKPVMPKAQTV